MKYKIWHETLTFRTEEVTEVMDNVRGNGGNSIYSSVSFFVDVTGFYL